jgi:hypothetical protein
MLDLSVPAPAGSVWDMQSFSARLLRLHRAKDEMGDGTPAPSPIAYISFFAVSER